MRLAVLLLLLYLPALLLFALFHAGQPFGSGCATDGLCAFLGGAVHLTSDEPQIGDVLLVGVILGCTWLLAAVLIVRWRTTESHYFVVLAAHGLLLYAGVRTGHEMLAQIKALRIISELSSHCPPQYDLRNGWRVVDGSVGASSGRQRHLGGSTGAVPVRTFAEGLACQKMVRVGGYGLSGVSDGSKMLCMDEEVEVADQKCVIVSVGSNGDFSFEEAMRSAFPACTVHTFDGTMKGRPGFAGPPAWLAPSFHYENFGPESYKLPAFAGGETAVLKMDCEGCENIALLPAVRSSCANLILVEIHDDGQGSMARLLTALNETHALYYAEPNPVAHGCIEFALKRRKACRSTSHRHRQPAAVKPRKNATTTAKRKAPHV